MLNHIISYTIIYGGIIMWHDILMVVIGLLIGAIAGFFIARTVMKNYMKKNPPINEDMIKMMMSGMGRTPTQKQVNQMMKNMQKYM